MKKSKILFVLVIVLIVFSSLLLVGCSDPNNGNTENNGNEVVTPENNYPKTPAEFIETYLESKNKIYMTKAYANIYSYVAFNDKIIMNLGKTVEGKIVGGMIYELTADNKIIQYTNEEIVEENYKVWTAEYIDNEKFFENMTIMCGEEVYSFAELCEVLNNTLIENFKQLNLTKENLQNNFIMENGYYVNGLFKISINNNEMILYHSEETFKLILDDIVIPEEARNALKN